MRKKILFGIIICAAVVLTASGAVFGKQYYENRYLSSDYYAIVPPDYDMTQKPVYSMSGAKVGDGVRYNLTAYNDKGEAKTVSFTVYEPGSSISRGEEQPQPGAYLCISASKQIVTGWRVIEENNVPEAALAMIRGEK